jgi:hypothetical protein
MHMARPPRRRRHHPRAVRCDVVLCWRLHPRPRRCPRAATSHVWPCVRTTNKCAVSIGQALTTTMSSDETAQPPAELPDAPSEAHEAPAPEAAPESVQVETTRASRLGDELI